MLSRISLFTLVPPSGPRTLWLKIAWLEIPSNFTKSLARIGAMNAFVSIVNFVLRYVERRYIECYSARNRRVSVDQICTLNLENVLPTNAILGANCRYADPLASKSTLERNSPLTS